jgi:hypothetical protein
MNPSGTFSFSSGSLGKIRGGCSALEGVRTWRLSLADCIERWACVSRGALYEDELTHEEFINAHLASKGAGDGRPGSGPHFAQQQGDWREPDRTPHQPDAARGHNLVDSVPQPYRKPRFRGHVPASYPNLSMSRVTEFERLQLIDGQIGKLNGLFAQGHEAATRNRNPHLLKTFHANLTCA